MHVVKSFCLTRIPTHHLYWGAVAGKRSLRAYLGRYISDCSQQNKNKKKNVPFSAAYLLLCIFFGFLGKEKEINKTAQSLLAAVLVSTKKMFQTREEIDCEVFRRWMGAYRRICT